MPSPTTTIEDNSPLISYSVDRQEGSSASDGLVTKYSQSSFTAPHTAGGFASFTFYGTGVQVFGAMRDNHGLYVVKVDDTLHEPQNGKASDGFQRALFSVSDLAQGKHVVTITNLGTTWLDIDCDSDPSFVYAPAESSWTTNPIGLGTFFGGSGHAATSHEAFVTYTVKVKVYLSLVGPVGPDGSPYAVQLDNISMTNFTSNKSRYTPQMLLYHANNLDPGTHRLKLLYQPSMSWQMLAIDYATVYTTMGPKIETDDGSRMNSLSAGSIVGITLGIIGMLGILGGVFIYLRRRRGRETGYEEKTNVVEPFESQQHGRTSIALTISRFGPGSQVTPQSDSSHVSPCASTDNPNHWHQVRFTEAESESQPSYTSSSGIGSSALANSASPRQGLPTTSIPRKGEAIELPSAAGRPLEYIPPGEFIPSRTVVPGRAQDLGPSPYTFASSRLSAIPSTVAHGDNDGDGLPPDYSQATEPYVGRP